MLAFSLLYIGWSILTSDAIKDQSRLAAYQSGQRTGNEKNPKLVSSIFILLRHVQDSTRKLVTETKHNQKQKNQAIVKEENFGFAMITDS